MTSLPEATAQAAQFACRPWPGTARRSALHTAADALSARATDIIGVAMAETGLSEQRLRGELDRTTSQLKLLADHAVAGQRRVSAAAASGGADVVSVAVPIGPVAVFAASNFPLAFGVSGGDTASALAAGCPVVVKAHPAQPQTARLLGEILQAALPSGAFHLVHGGADVSLALVRAPQIRAVGFTGSLTGGRALMDAAAARPDPIAVYAEMGSLNPVFVLPGAATDANAAALAAAVTGSSGQLCTKPGLVVTDSSGFARQLAAQVAAAVTHRLLTPGMADAHAAWLEKASGIGAVVCGEGVAQPFAVTVGIGDLEDELLEEHFGPAVVIAVGAAETYAQVAERLAGSLTATVLAGSSDREAAVNLLPALALRAGRLVWNGVPTGVAVCEAMHHGGPWPASSAPWSTSVGTEAVERFRRPIALQGFTEELMSTLAP